MNYKEIQDLIKLVMKSDLSEVKVKDGETELTIKTKFCQAGSGVAVPMTQYVAPAPVATPSPVTITENQPVEISKQPTEATNLKEIRSPMVGTFYRSPGPDKPAFVKPGDQVTAGSVVCIVEAMKLFNEIESDVSGTIVKVLVDDASPIEYDQVLFLVE